MLLTYKAGPTETVVPEGCWGHAGVPELTSDPREDVASSLCLKARNAKFLHLPVQGDLAILLIYPQAMAKMTVMPGSGCYRVLSAIQDMGCPPIHLGSSLEGCDGPGSF